MIYYAVVYMKTGEIHLKPFNSKEKAEECLNKLSETKWKDGIDVVKIVKKDTSTTLWKNSKGYWIGA